MTRDLATGWNSGSSPFAKWTSPIRRTLLVAPLTCTRCNDSIPAGAPAVFFTGASRTATYHEACARALGIRPTS